MEINVEDLKNYIGVPVCLIFRKPGHKNPIEEWLVVKEVKYTKEVVEVTFTDGDTHDVKREKVHTELFISV